MDHTMHHPAQDKGAEPDPIKTIQPEHHGDSVPADMDRNTLVQPMHHGSASDSSGSDHTTTARPMHHGGDTAPHRTGAGSHVHDLEDFKKRFIISTIITIPILLLSPVIQSFLGFRFDFPGSTYVTLILASIVYFYGGYPFLTGIVRELRARTPGMMTLIAVAISVAYFYSAAVVFGLKGEGFFWELATLDRYHASRALDRDEVGPRGLPCT